jgi:hypothetical protein
MQIFPQTGIFSIAIQYPEIGFTTQLNTGRVGIQPYDMVIAPFQGFISRTSGCAPCP